MWVRSSFGDAAVAPTTTRRRARPARPARPGRPTAAVSWGPAGGLWAQRHRPGDCQQLAVHRGKVEELERWLTDTRRRLTAGQTMSPFLLVTGPAGCGKSACVRCLAEKLGMPLVQWTSPSSARYQPDRLLAAEGAWEGAGDTVTPEGQLRQFADFMVRANRYCSVLPSGDGAARLVLVDDLPNALVYKKEEFYDILRRYGRGARSPCVFVLSEGGARSDLSTLSVFPDTVRADLGIHQITFRPLTTKQLVSAMERVLAAESVNTPAGVNHPGRPALEQLAAASSGDVRAAINALQFLCVQGQSQSGAGAGQTRPPQNTTAGLQQSAAAVGSRDASLGLFRAVGKIIYAKRADGLEEAPLPLHLSDRRRAPLLERSPEQVCERAGVQPDTVIAHLHHNYVHFCPRLEDAVTGATYISDADLLTADWQSRLAMQAYGSSVAARGVMFCRQSSVSLGFRQFSQPRLTSVQQQRSRRLEDLRQSLAGWRVTTETMVTDFLPFLDQWRVSSHRHNVMSLPNQDISFYKSLYQPTLDRAGSSSDGDEDGEDALEIEEYVD